VRELGEPNRFTHTHRRSAPESIEPAHDGALASELFSYHLTEDVFIEREVGHQALEACILIAQRRSSRISVSPSLAYFFFQR